MDIRPYSLIHQEILKIYEQGVYQNPNKNYKDVSEKEINEIRKKITPTPTEIKRYKLWLEQGYISPYTSEVIPLSELFSNNYEIEHIIPNARYFDDLLNNKIICESDVNRDKSDKTAYEYIKEKGGSIVNLGNNKSVELLKLYKYEKHCSIYFKNNRIKLKNLLSEDIPEGFIERQINDTRYIAKFVKGLLSNIVREKDEKEATSKKLITIPGSITSKLKQDWDLNDKWNEIITPRFKRLNEIDNSFNYGQWDKKINTFRIKIPDNVYKKGFDKKRIDHRHHAMDAIVIACTTKEHINYLNSLNAEKTNFKLREKLLIKSKNGDFTKNFKLPWQNFSVDVKNILETTIITFKQNLRVINKTNNKTYQWIKKKNGEFKKELVKQTKGENWAIRKSLHKETVYGRVEIKEIVKNKKKIIDYIDKPELIVDRKLRKKIKNLQVLFKNDFKKINFF